jgi:hypothetical protein
MTTVRRINPPRQSIQRRDTETNREIGRPQKPTETAKPKQTSQAAAITAEVFVSKVKKLAAFFSPRQINNGPPFWIFLSRVREREREGSERPLLPVSRPG